MQQALEQALDRAEYIIESARQRPPKRKYLSSGRKSVFQKLYDLYTEECEKEPEIKQKLRRNVNLLEKLVMQETLSCLVVNLYPGNEGYSLMLRGKNGSDSETIRLPYEEGELLEYLDAEELPPILVDLLEKSQVNIFHCGCVIAEIRDYRQSGNMKSPTYQSKHILLRPTMQVEKYAKVEKSIKPDDSQPTVWPAHEIKDDYVFECEVGNQLQKTKLTIFQSLGNPLYYGKIQTLKGDEENDNLLTPSQFLIGSKTDAERVVNQYQELVQSEAKCPVKIFHNSSGSVNLSHLSPGKEMEGSDQGPSNQDQALSAQQAAVINLTGVGNFMQPQATVPLMMDEGLDYLEKKVAMEYCKKYGSDKVQLFSVVKSRGRGGAVRKVVFYHFSDLK
ncbi:hypothetical protein BTVI_128879 [Pitangus sulphuratus]|nr:hypothetical protein BTVI_128879 [Pitangus sulphuratus]